MKVIVVLVVVFSSLNCIMVLDALQSQSTKLPLRLQISGVCTKSIVEKTTITQLVTKRISQRCPNNRDTTCRLTKYISYQMYKPITRKRLVEACCPGYRKSGDKCEPICSVRCDNGICTQPNFCTCYPQYRKISEYHCAPVCNDCHHGICVYPNVCKCFLNYERHKNGTCVPICKNQCINAACTSPDTCSCNEGYLLNKMYPNICTPICNLPCGKGGVCHEPDVCLCARNYRVNETNQCEPVCNTCENGMCIDPDVCECNENYRLVRTAKNVTYCEPMMSTSDESDFETTIPTEFVEYEEMTSDYDDVPNEIFEYYPSTLLSSYSTILDMPSTTDDNLIITTLPMSSYQTTTPQIVYINETNEKKCDTECLNGECTDGYCICNEGYYDSELIPNHCDPICEFYSADGCINGTCIAPNVCSCYDEYVAISDHVCIPQTINPKRAMDHNQFTVPGNGIKNLTRQFVSYLLGTLAVLLLVTLISFIIYKWYNRQMSYHLQTAESVQFGAQYMAEDDGCEL